MEDYYHSRLMQLFFREVKEAETMGVVAKAETQRADRGLGNMAGDGFAQQAAQIAAQHAHNATALKQAIKYIRGRKG